MLESKGLKENCTQIFFANKVLIEAVATCNADKKRYTVGLTVSAAGTKLEMQILFRRKTVPDELNERPEDNIHAWVAENGNTTDETMADLVNTILLPHLLKHGGGPGVGKRRTLFIVDGAGSHKGSLFKSACRKNNIDLAVIPASCTDEIQLVDVAVNKPFKDGMYFEWAMWMMKGPHKVQPKSGNRVAAGFLDILRWCKKAWDGVKRETILKSVEKCYMQVDPGERFDVEDRAEEIAHIKNSDGPEKEKKKVKVLKSKTPEELAKLAKRKENRRKRLEREQRKREKEQNGGPKKQKKPVSKKKRKKKVARRKVVRRKQKK